MRAISHVRTYLRRGCLHSIRRRLEASARLDDQLGHTCPPGISPVPVPAAAESSVPLAAAPASTGPAKRRIWRNCNRTRGGEEEQAETINKMEAAAAAAAAARRDVKPLEAQRRPPPRRLA